MERLEGSNMINPTWIIVNPGALSIQVVELTKENIDEVIGQLWKSGYKAGKSNHYENAIYFNRSGGSGEPNRICVGELLVIDGNEWTPLNKKEFNLSDANIRKAISEQYFSN